NPRLSGRWPPRRGRGDPPSTPASVCVPTLGHASPDQHRVSRCGRARLAPSPAVALAPDGSAHFRGLVTCGSVTACPVCAAKVRQARAEEIDRALGRHLCAGGGAVFVTLTMPHDAGMPLER